MKKARSHEEQLLKIIDSLIYRLKKQDAWISALAEKAVFFESSSTGKSLKEAKRDLSKRQKFYLQKIMEKVEDRDPALAAKLDPRTAREV